MHSFSLSLKSKKTKYTKKYHALADPQVQYKLVKMCGCVERKNTEEA